MERIHQLLDRLLGPLFDQFLTVDDRLPNSSFPYDVGAAIGIGTSQDGQRVNTRSEAVVRQVADWYLKKRIYNIALIGSARTGPNGLTEAEAMYKWMRGQTKYNSIPDERIILIKEKSNTTLLNVLGLTELMQKRCWKHAIVSAERDHAARVRATLQKQWFYTTLTFRLIKAAKVPYTGDSGGKFIRRWNFVPYNLLAFVLYKLKGYA